jgi:hypothetical protein
VLSFNVKISTPLGLVLFAKCIRASLSVFQLCGLLECRNFRYFLEDPLEYDEQYAAGAWLSAFSGAIWINLQPLFNKDKERWIPNCKELLNADVDRFLPSHI